MESSSRGNEALTSPESVEEIRASLSRLPRTKEFSNRLLTLLSGLAFHLLFPSSALAAAPTLDHLFPVAVQAGATNTVTAIGKFDPWPPKVWLDTTGVVFRAETNNGKFSVEVAPHAPAGPHLLRFYNEQGASGPRFLLVTSEPQLAEIEPNDDFKKPQAIERLPAWLNGRLEKSGDVDSFSVALEAGQTLVASVEAYTLASPVDAVLRLVDSRGVQMAWNHDDGRTLDPFLAWTARSAATYVLQVFGFAYPAESDVKFTGSPKCVYRLHLSRGPFLRQTLPLGVQRGASTTLQLMGWNLGKCQETEFDGTAIGTGKHTSLRLPGFDNALLLPVGDGPELTEPPRDAAAPETNRLHLPCAVTGCIARSEEEDRFIFEAKKDEKTLLEVQSASLGFPLDPWLRIEDLAGKELAKNDDGGGADPKLEWTAPKDGLFVAAVGNVLHRGGPEYLYRLELRKAQPSLKATVSEAAFTIAPGKTNELKVTLKRLHGFQSRLNVSLRGLPGGLSAEPVDVPEKAGDVTLKLVAPADAGTFSGSIQVVVSESESSKEYPVMAELTGSTVNNGVPGGFNKLAIEATDQLWLTVLPIPSKKADEKK